MPQRAQRHQKRLRPILLDKKPRVNILIHMVKYSRSLDATFKASPIPRGEESWQNLPADRLPSRSSPGLTGCRFLR